jgi:predicted RNA-binding protein YlqC (UPF0109 family)
MKGLVEVIAKALVDDPAPVEVFATGSVDEPVYRLKVGKDDLGKVIGKKGRTAKAFRTLIAAAASKQDLRPTVEILEPERPRRTDLSSGLSSGEASPSSAADAPSPVVTSSTSRSPAATSTDPPADA